MTSGTDSLVLEHLRAIRLKLDEHDGKFREVLGRLLRVGAGIATLRRDQAGDAEAVVGVQAQLDSLKDEVERIKRRLDLADSRP